MLCYLLRHAIAIPRGSAGYPNDDRPLTVDGIEKITKASQGIAKLIPSIDKILTIPLKRAHETAVIVGKALEAYDTIEICKHLAPGESQKNLLLFLAKYSNLQSVMSVGHEPDLSVLASTLLGSRDIIIELKKGAICCINIDTLPPKQPGTLLWLIQPKQLRQIGS